MYTQILIRTVVIVTKKMPYKMIILTTIRVSRQVKRTSIMIMNRRRKIIPRQIGLDRNLKTSKTRGKYW